MTTAQTSHATEHGTAAGLALTQGQARVAWRNDLLEETALFGRAWDRICRRDGCGRDETWLAPVP